MASPSFVALGGALSLISGLVALVVSFVAYKYLKLSDFNVLTYISISFMLLGVGLLLQGALGLMLGLKLGNVYEDARAAYFIGVIYLLVENVAYIILVMGYAEFTFWPAAAPLIVITPIELRRFFLLGHVVFDVSQLISILLLMILVFETLLLSSRSRGSFSRLLLVAFIVLLLSHVVMLYSSMIMTPFYYIVGELIQFVSFTLILIFLLGWYRVG
ncbi:MAG: hypothetical protein ACP5HK_01295 [Acidilobus sp.]